MNKIIFIIALSILFSIRLLSAEFELPKDTKLIRDTDYIIRLVNGDIITGKIVEISSEGDEEHYIKVKTEIGTATIYFSQIYDISLKSEQYKHNHRLFLMPTAEAIGTNHFIGDFELLFIYAGIGISDFLSITAGRSVVPAVPASQQISTVGAKFTLLTTQFDSIARSVSVAVGGNIGFANNFNRLVHLYGTGTVNFGRTSLTANIIYKIGSLDYYEMHFQNTAIPFVYTNGSFGIGIGLDSKLPKRNDIHLIGELWNIDVTRPTNTAILLGFRIVNSSFSADFGFSFFTQPYLAPFASFVWTPF